MRVARVVCGAGHACGAGDDLERNAVDEHAQLPGRALATRKGGARGVLAAGGCKGRSEGCSAGHVLPLLPERWLHLLDLLTNPRGTHQPHTGAGPVPGVRVRGEGWG